MNFYTYGHFTESGRLFYIGKGKGVRANCKTNRNKHWQNVVNKHGLKVSIFARWATEKEAFDHERLLISCFRDDLGFKLVNCTDGGEGSAGLKVSEDRKVLLSKTSKDLWKSPEYVAKMKKRPKGSFTEKKRESSLKNVEKARLSLASEKKASAAKKNSDKSSAMWANPDFRAKMKETHRKIWDEDRRAAQGLRTGGRVRMNNGIVERNVLPAEVELLLQQGWTRGRGPNSPSKRTNTTKFERS